MCLLDVEIAEVTSALDRRLSDGVGPREARSLDGRARS
jgi:hypothetical protein